MGIDRLVFGTGDLVTGWGRLRAADGAVWLDPGGWTAYGEPPVSPDAVRLHGADPAAVATDHGPDGSIPGWGTVTGRWLGDAIEVRHQSPHRPDPPRPVEWTTPPCPPPAGGWAAGEDLDFDLGDLQDTGAAVSVVVFRPGAGRLVLVVAAADPAAVERRLRPPLGPRLCVVPSRWTKGQLDAAAAGLADHRTDWGIRSVGRRPGPDGQAAVEATVVRVLSELARWAAGLPDGLLRVLPMLTPAG